MGDEIRRIAEPGEEPDIKRSTSPKKQGKPQPTHKPKAEPKKEKKK